MAKRKNEDGTITKEYRTWKSMKARCYCESQKDRGNYRSNGIIVCDEWKSSFEKFIEDMGLAPSKNHSIERIDNTKNYEPSNCVWATMLEQSNNRGDFNKVISYNGLTMTLKQWSKELNIKYTTLYNRLYRGNLSFSEAILSDPYNNLIPYNGKKQTLKMWSEELRIPYQILVDRKRRKWEIERMFEQPIRLKSNN